MGQTPAPKIAGEAVGDVAANAKSGLKGVPISELKELAELQFHVFERPRPRFDAFMINMPRRIEAMRDMASSSVYGTNDAHQAHALHSYKLMLNHAVHAMAQIMFLRCASDDMLQPVLETVSARKAADQHDTSLGINRRYSTPGQSKVPISGMIVAASMHVPTMYESKNAKNAIALVEAIEHFPRRVIQSDDAKDDLNSWLDDAEAQIKEAMDRAAKAYRKSEKLQSYVQSNAKEYAVFTQPTFANIRAKAEQILLNFLAVGLDDPKELDMDPYSENLFSHIVWTGRSNGGPNLTEKCLKNSGFVPNIFFRISKTHEPRTPLAIEVVDSAIPGIEARVKRMVEDLERAARVDYYNHAIITRVVAALRPAEDISDGDGGAVKRKTQDMQSNRISTDALSSAGHAVAAVLERAAWHIVDEAWQETPDGDEVAVMDVPDGMTIEGFAEDVTDQLRDSPVLVTVHDDQVVVIMRPEEEGAELVPVQTDQEVLDI